MSILNPERTAAMQAIAEQSVRFAPDRNAFAARITAAVKAEEQAREQTKVHKAHMAAFLRHINNAAMDVEVGNVGLARATLELSIPLLKAAINALP